MKRLVLLVNLFALPFSFSYAQSWQCLQPGVKHYFTNGNGYLRGMRVDSVTIAGANTILYPFRMLRGAYDSGAGGLLSLDNNGGSWLGKKVVAHPDGTYVFDSYWGPDSVVMKTQAGVGDSWTFYSDTSSLYYTATVASVGAMTLSSGPDSIKTILINARTVAGIDTADPVNGFKLILSKNNGFIRVCDLYTFPYHKPDSAYRAGLDFMLDHSTCTYANVQAPYGHTPDTTVSLFTLTDIVVPTDTQLYAMHVGDIIESRHEYGLSPFSVGGDDYLLDTVTSVTTSGTTSTVTFSGTSYGCSHSEPCELLANAGVYTYNATHLAVIDTSKMTETWGIGAWYFYYPGDGAGCITSPAYVVAPMVYSPPLSLDFEYDYAKYKIGIGRTSYYHLDDAPVYESDVLIYSFIDSVRCGIPLDTFRAITKKISAAEAVKLSPNPAFSTLSVSCPGQIATLEIIDMLGERVYADKPASIATDVDVTKLPSGIYFVRINGTVTLRFVKN